MKAKNVLEICVLMFKNPAFWRFVMGLTVAMLTIGVIVDLFTNLFTN